MEKTFRQPVPLNLLGAAIPHLQGRTVLFTYTSATDAFGTTPAGDGSFSYNGPLATIGLGDITAFNFELTLSNPSQIVNPWIFDCTLTDLESFSATVSGDVVTSLSLQTGFEFATNTDAAEGERLTVNSLDINGADNDVQNSLDESITVADYGTITTQSAPEPSTTVLVAGAGLLLMLKSRVFGRAKR